MLSHEALDGDLCNIRDLTSISRDFICAILIAKARVTRAYPAPDLPFVLSMRCKCHYHQRDELHPLCCEDYKEAEEREKLKTQRKAKIQAKRAKLEAKNAKKAQRTNN